MAETIFERYGGFAKASRVVAAFYASVLESPELEPYFAGVDMRRLMDHQTKFIAFLMGGPASFSREHLGRVHERLHIDDAAFDEMIDLLRETFADFDFDQTDIAAMHSKVASYRSVIVSRHDGDLEAAGDVVTTAGEIGGDGSQRRHSSEDRAGLRP